MDAVEVTPHVWSLPAQPAFYTGPQAPNVFLVQDGDEAALIDSGFGDEQSVAARREFLRSRPRLWLRYIVLTHHHFDHSSGASDFKADTGAEVVLHRDEEKFLLDPRSEAPQDFEEMWEKEEVRRGMQALREKAARTPPDVRAGDGDVLRVGGLTIEVVHTPGHTLGSVCLYLREERALFTGDTVLGLGTVAVSPPPYGDMGLYIQSLERLKRLDAALLLPGHGQTVRDVRAKLQELIDHRLEREQQILRLLADGKRTPKAMLPAIYAELDRRIVPMALRQIEAHLCKLEAEGRVRRAGDGWAPAG